MLALQLGFALKSLLQSHTSSWLLLSLRSPVDLEDFPADLRDVPKAHPPGRERHSEGRIAAALSREHHPVLYRILRQLSAETAGVGWIDEWMHKRHLFVSGRLGYDAQPVQSVAGAEQEGCDVTVWDDEFALCSPVSGLLFRLLSNDGQQSSLICQRNRMYESTVCEGTNIELNSDLITVSRGGENMNSVVNRSESMELPELAPGAFTAYCSARSGDSPRLARNTHLDKVLRSFLFLENGSPQPCR